MRKMVAVILLALLLIPWIPSSAFAEESEYGFFYADYGEVWYVSGVVDMDMYYHEGRDEMIEYYYAKLSPEAYEFVYYLAEGIEAPPGPDDAACEVMIYTFDENYDLDDCIGDVVCFTGEVFEAMTLYHRWHIVVEVTGVLYSYTPEGTPSANGVE